MAKFAQTPRLRPAMSEEQRRKLSEAQKAYFASDPRAAAHRQKLAAAQRRPSQRAKLSEKQKAYMETDPRWPEHEARWREASAAVCKMTLFPEEVQTVIEERRKGRTMEYIAEQLRVDRKVLSRELKALGVVADRGGNGLRLLPEEVDVIVAERRKGRTMEFVSEELGISRGVIRRELKALGVVAERGKIGPVVKRGRGFWRSFDE